MSVGLKFLALLIVASCSSVPSNNPEAVNLRILFSLQYLPGGSPPTNVLKNTFSIAIDGEQRFRETMIDRTAGHTPRSDPSFSLSPGQHQIKITLEELSLSRILDLRIEKDIAFNVYFLEQKLQVKEVQFNLQRTWE